MIYTIGHTLSYEAAFEQDPAVEKQGRRENYAGGSVWRTYEEAVVFAKDGFSVYGVQADFEEDTTRSAEGSWYDLIRSARLVKLDR